MAGMKLKYAILYVKDVPAALAFYENAFKLTRKMLHEGGDYGELDTGQTILAFSSLALMTGLGKSPQPADASHPTFEIAFESTNVSQALSHALNNGASLIQECREEPWGQTTAYVTDPNGFLIEICSPITPVA